MRHRHRTLLGSEDLCVLIWVRESHRMKGLLAMKLHGQICSRFQQLVEDAITQSNVKWNCELRVATHNKLSPQFHIHSTWMRSRRYRSRCTHRGIRCRCANLVANEQREKCQFVFHLIWCISIRACGTRWRSPLKTETNISIWNNCHLCAPTAQARMGSGGARGAEQYNGQ